MRALVYQGPETLVMQEAAEPVARVGEILLDVHSVGICAGHRTTRRPCHSYIADIVSSSDQSISGPVCLGITKKLTTGTGEWIGCRSK